MYDKKFSMDSDYREYYRDRPRGGEFLTRGAALSAGPSQARGRQQQYQQVSNTARIGRNASSEKIATARNPTILRKSESATFNIISNILLSVVFRIGRLCLLDVRSGRSDGGGGGG